MSKMVACSFKDVYEREEEGLAHFASMMERLDGWSFLWEQGWFLALARKATSLIYPE